VIPWDYDADFGTLEDRSRVLEIYGKEKSLSIKQEVDGYKDPGCLYASIADKYFSDIVFYTEKDDKIDSLMSEATKADCPAFDKFTFRKEEFFPLKEVLFLGHNAYTVSNPDPGLRREYGDWTKIPSKFAFVDEKFLRPPIRDIPEKKALNISELIALVEDSKEPFIIRSFPLLAPSEDEFGAIVTKQTKPVYGYDTEIIQDPESIYISSNDAWKQFKEGSLKINIVDSVLEDRSSLSEEWRAYSEKKIGDEFKCHALSLVLTLAPKTTDFHTDPPYAGGFMKLLKGNKIWWFIHADDYQYLLKAGYKLEDLQGLTMCKLLQLEKGYLFGKVFAGRIKNGDFIWFPKNTPHKVITIESSYGFGGYL